MIKPQDKTPEVGDVWVFDNGLKFIILKETLSKAMPFGEDIEYPAYEVLEESLEPNFFDELPFINGTFTYLGKSKVNISDLFKTENEKMIKIHKTKVPAEIGVMSLVGIHNKDYPLSYGNYFTMKVEKEYQIPNLNESMSEEGIEIGFMVCNFNCENFREARSRFLLDNEVEITIFQVDEKYPFIAITDERIPENWYCLWNEDMGYCNGQIHGENYQEVARTLGKRFGGDENYVYVKPERIIATSGWVDIKSKSKKLNAKFTIVDNTGL